MKNQGDLEEEKKTPPLPITNIIPISPEFEKKQGKYWVSKAPLKTPGKNGDIFFGFMFSDPKSMEIENEKDSGKQIQLCFKRNKCRDPTIYKNDEKHLQRETDIVELLKKKKHENLLKTFEVFKEGDYTYFVTE